MARGVVRHRKGNQKKEPEKPGEDDEEGYVGFGQRPIGRRTRPGFGKEDSSGSH